MASQVFPYGTKGLQSKTFKVATAAITYGLPVEVEGEGTIQTSDNFEDCIGFTQIDEAYEALSGSTSHAVGELAEVILRGPVVKLMAGTTITAGDKLVLDTDGVATNTFQSGTTAAGKLTGIALEGSAVSTTFDAVVFM